MLILAMLFLMTAIAIGFFAAGVGKVFVFPVAVFAIAAVLVALMKKSLSQKH
jgi:uncharacterized membrane protein